MAKKLLPHEKPWCVCRLGAKPTNRIIRRYVNRQDAERDLQLTSQLTQGGQYVIAFDVVETEL